MYKVEWNKDHTWKITKYYKKDKLKKFNYYGNWFSASTDNSCYDYDECGNRYIACDCCDNCSLEGDCRPDNPIYNACAEFDRCNISIHPCLPPNKRPKITIAMRKILNKEEIEWLRYED